MGKWSIDAAGAIYMSDGANHNLWKIAPDGTRIQIAGKGYRQYFGASEGGGGDWTEGGFAGDGGPAINAEFNGPGQPLIDADGNVLIADVGNHRVRKIVRIAAPGLLNGVPFPANGDVTRDGKTDLADAVGALGATIGSKAISIEQKAFADMNGDGALDLRDVVLLLRKVVGL